MLNVLVDVLTRIIERLNVKEMFQLLSVNKSFYEVLILALKKEDKLVAKSFKDPDVDGCCESMFLSSSTECFTQEHVVNKRSYLPFEPFEEDRVAEFILNHLPGLKVAFFEDSPLNLMKCLSENCPLLECLTIGTGWGYKFWLWKLPTLKHLDGIFDNQSIGYLSEYFPSLTCLSINGYYLRASILDSSDLIEGLKTIHMISLNKNWNSALSSKAMKTVEHLTMSTGAEEALQEVPGEMPQLNKLVITDFSLSSESFTNLCLFVRRSHKLQVLNLQGIKCSLATEILEIPVQMFHLMYRLREVSLPILSNTNQAIKAIGLNCPLIEKLSVSRMSKTGKNEALEKMTQMNKLVRVDITNNVDGMTLDDAFTLEDLQNFAASNTRNGHLRFTFNLHQNTNFPLSDPEKTFTEIYGIQWNK